jgi:hypothetical protein
VSRLSLGCCGEFAVEFQVGIEQNSVVYLGFGEQNVPAVTLLAAFFDGFSDGDDGILTLLRFMALA